MVESLATFVKFAIQFESPNKAAYTYHQKQKFVCQTSLSLAESDVFQKQWTTGESEVTFWFRPTSFRLFVYRPTHENDSRQGSANTNGSQEAFKKNCRFACVLSLKMTMIPYILLQSTWPGPPLYIRNTRGGNNKAVLNS